MLGVANTEISTLLNPKTVAVDAKKPGTPLREPCTAVVELLDPCPMGVGLGDSLLELCLAGLGYLPVVGPGEALFFVQVVPAVAAVVADSVVHDDRGPRKRVLDACARALARRRVRGVRGAFQRALLAALPVHRTVRHALWAALPGPQCEEGREVLAMRVEQEVVGDVAPEGGINSLFCPSQEKFHTVVLKRVRDISDTLENPPMKILL